MCVRLALIILVVAIACTPDVAAAGSWNDVAVGSDTSTLRPDLLVTARGNTVAFRWYRDAGTHPVSLVQGPWGSFWLFGYSQNDYRSLDAVAITTNGYAYLLAGGVVRYNDRLSDGSPWSYKKWNVLGNSTTWPPSLIAPRLVAQDGPEGLVFFSFMYANYSISVMQNSMSRVNSSWTPLSFPVASSGSLNLFPSAALQGPTLKLSNSGKLYMLVLDVGCSSRNASVLQLVNDKFEFVGQRCFCDAVSASLVVPDEGLSIMVVETGSTNNVWQLSPTDSVWRKIAFGFTFQAASILQYAVLPNSTNLVAVGSIANGVNYLFFNNCTNRFESQSEYLLDWYHSSLMISLSDDGRPFVMFVSRPNPEKLMKPDYAIRLVAFDGKVPDPDHTVSCISCPLGTINGSCMSCPIDFEAVTSGRCAKCLAGYYSKGGSHHCSCVPGYVSLSPSGPCVHCRGNYYMPNYDGTACIQCPETSPVANSDNTACMLCPAGTTTDAYHVRCNQCSPGSYSSQPGSWACSYCTPGTYAPNAGQTSCTSCPAGTYNPYNGAAVCLKCPDSSKIGSTVGNVDCEGMKDSRGSTARITEMSLLLTLLSTFITLMSC